MYKTKQREELLHYIESIPGQHFTVNDVCRFFMDKGTPIGQTTVYRQLEKLVNEGTVNKYIIDNGSPACFEFSPHRPQKGEPCFHCKCEICGKLIHLRCEELEGIGQHLREHHAFTLDPMRTVFYGICEECRLKDEEEQVQGE